MNHCLMGFDSCDWDDLNLKSLKSLKSLRRRTGEARKEVRKEVTFHDKTNPSSMRMEGSHLSITASGSLVVALHSFCTIVAWPPPSLDFTTGRVLCITPVRKTVLDQNHS